VYINKKKAIEIAILVQQSSQNLNSTLDKRLLNRAKLGVTS
jgi:hypothetical protein